MRLSRSAFFALLLIAAAGAAAAAEPILPWVRHVAPDRFCLRFGDYDWLRFIRDTEALEQRGRKAAAFERERALGETLWYLGRGSGRICSCSGKAAVLADLKRMLPALKQRPDIAHQDMPAAAHVEGVIAGIEAEGIAVVPPAHAGCKR